MKKVLSLLLVLLIIGGGGVLLAQQADAAEPGDTLYPIDVLAEKVQRVLIFDEIKRTEFEEDVLGERVSELQSVSAKDGNVDEILQAVSEQQERVRQQLRLLENNPENYSEDALKQTQNRYEQQLEQHIEVMEQVQNKGEDSAIQIKQKLEENLESCRSGTCGSSTSGNEDGSNTDGGVDDQGNTDNSTNGPQGGSSNGNPNN